MITVISATNRPQSYTSKVATTYVKLLEGKGIAAKYLTLEHLPLDFAFQHVSDPYSLKMSSLVDEFIVSSKKFVIVSPEYNGSFPGVLKTFIDIVQPKAFLGKKAALIGLSSGSAGNNRGMDHLTNILNYINIDVLSYKVAIPHILDVVDEKMNSTMSGLY